MADEEKAPKGVLTVTVALNLPAYSDSIYRILNHGYPERRETVFTQDCTQQEAQQITDKIRDANPHNQFHATWTGASEL